MSDDAFDLGESEDAIWKHVKRLRNKDEIRELNHLENLEKELRYDLSKSEIKTITEHCNKQYTENVKDDGEFEKIYKSENGTEIGNIDDVRKLWIKEIDNPFRHQNRRAGIHITPRHLKVAHTAIEIANHHGLLMNVELTITPNAVGLSKADEVEAIQRQFFKKFGGMCRRWGISPRYIVVFEWGARRGYHFHAAIALPPDTMEKFRRWIKPAVYHLLSNGQPAKGLLFVKVRSKPTLESQWRWFRYLMKGLDPEAVNREGARVADVAGISKMKSPGLWPYKRVRVSECSSFSAALKIYLRYPGWHKNCAVDWQSSYFWDNRIANFNYDALQETGRVVAPRGRQPRRPAWKMPSHITDGPDPVDRMFPQPVNPFVNMR